MIVLAFLRPQSSGVAQTFGTNVCPRGFRRDSSCTSRPCCRSPRTRVRCIGSRRCGTSGTWILPLTRSKICTGGWTRSRQSTRRCTCSLQPKKGAQRRESQNPVNVVCGNKRHLSQVITFKPQGSYFYFRGEKNLLQISATICFGGFNELIARLCLKRSYYYEPL